MLHSLKDIVIRLVLVIHGYSHLLRTHHTWLLYEALNCCIIHGYFKLVARYSRELRVLWGNLLWDWLLLLLLRSYHGLESRRIWNNLLLGCSSNWLESWCCNWFKSRLGWICICRCERFNSWLNRTCCWLKRLKCTLLSLLMLECGSWILLIELYRFETRGRICLLSSELYWLKIWSLLRLRIWSWGKRFKCWH